MKGSGWLLFALLAGGRLHAQTRPNIIFILADDMGYGDVSALNDRDNKVSTPHIDQLIANGMNFTDAHTPTAVCTPTRYAILTGRYAWRSKLKSMVLRQYDPPLIERDRLTVAGLLRQNGYKTAAFGKWHLGWDWPLDAGGTLHNS
ncbi:MAG TPA: sulfatase-like hydrolase/transferase, partial [Chitinophagaceae bacterium]|nr:sulfatase-like hydrolase/transferase [Chitinophagaceae bacterium]